MDPMQTFVAHFRAARYEDLSPEVVETVKITVLDTMGAALAGSASEAGRGIARLARRHGGGAGESTLVVHGGKIAPPMAALGNGVMARCLELDGTHEGGGGHVGVCMVPAALALAESAEAAVSGQTLILGCKYTHHAIATALRLVEAHDVTAGQVKRVTVATNTMGATQCGFDATGAPKIAPETANAAKFSIPFTVAAAIARRRVTLAEFTEASIREPGLRQLAGRIETRIDPAKDALPMLYPPMDVTIETTDGRALSGCEEFVKGDPRNPFTFDDCVERFMAAAASAARPLLADDLQRFVTMVERLEDVKDAAEMMPLLGGDRS